MQQVEKIKLYLMYAELELEECIEEAKHLPRMREKLEKKYDINVEAEAEDIREEASRVKQLNENNDELANFIEEKDYEFPEL
ncbi:MAG: hypothetical protein ACLFTA_01820 [Candidatus Nanohaloarchaea archaeon]